MSALATPIARTQRVLDDLPARSVVIDGHGDVWQQGPAMDTGYWYRAYDGEGRSSWDAAQVMGAKVVVLKRGAL
ncbi:hypothetical protein [Microbacterium sp. AR7-10]|uniref:hypothetical protein n=1 Tax=Microbacterium sp. AR7-10 TaxID=1891970 RepID=UPI0008FC2950|nr:hypothetical protein [Microbacterium sp. AR7-10]OIU88627.1 hypothetical protein BFN01_04080 [Microbacterium sp. AR7-10]